MSNAVKALLYVILAVGTCVSGYFFFQNFGALFEDEKPPVEAPAVPGADSAGQSVDATDTNAVPETNAAASEGTNIVADAGATNAVVDTNAVAETTQESTDENASASAAPPAPAPAAAPAKAPRIGMWTGLFILCVILLGALIAWDISNYLGNKSLKLLYNDEGEGMKDPEYDQAEQVWADGQPLEAIRMMREYLNKNPRQVHVSLRIAEIYEKDLSNFLAAALEYEDVLKKKLPAERWGWAAIHLCNLYFKLGQETKSYLLLQRLVKEYGETQAAEKARKRLAEVDPALLAEAEPPPTAPVEPPPDEPKSNLPPGFRPKK